MKQATTLECPRGLNSQNSAAVARTRKKRREGASPLLRLADDQVFGDPEADMFALAHDHILNAPHDAPGTAPNDAKLHEKTTELLGKERSGAATARLAVNCPTTFLVFMVMVTTSTKRWSQCCCRLGIGVGRDTGRHPLLSCESPRRLLGPR